MTSVPFFYTDTDSLILDIQTDNVYLDMKQNMEHFDTSNFSSNNIHGIVPNQSIVGKFKDECSGESGWFLGTDAK